MRSTVRQAARQIAGVVMLAAVIAAGCAPANPSVPAIATAAANTASKELAGTHVHVVGLWSGPELASFEAVKAEWERETGAIVDWEGTNDVPAALGDGTQADPPEIAILPNLAMLDRLADDERLIPLDSVLDMNAITRDYAPAWLDLGSRAEKLYGIFYKVTDKAAVWYNPKAFTAAGYAVPATWTEMTALADQIVRDGRTPFSVVAPSGPASGWALTDWVSEIVLSHCGPDVYDSWIAARIPWTDGCIRESFAMFTTIVSTPGYVLGGSERIVATGDDVGADPLYTDPPTAWLCYLPSFAQAFIAAHHPELAPGIGYDVFRFPSIDAEHDGSVTVGADVPVMLRDTPAARSFMAYLASARSQEAWIGLGGFTSVNRSVSLDAYPDPVARRVADELGRAKVSRFSAGDMMPASLQRAWWAAMLELVDDPTKLDAILDTLTAEAKAAR